MRLTGDKDFAVVWNWDDDKGPVGRPGKRGVLLSDGCDRRLYPYNHPQFQRLHEKEGGRVRNRMAEPREAPRPDASAALSKFDLRSGNNASNFNFEESKNTKLEYIRIVGGSGFPAQTLEFDGWEELKSLLSQPNRRFQNRRRNCLKLSTIATSTHLHSVVPVADKCRLEPTEVDERSCARTERHESSGRKKTPSRTGRNYPVPLFAQQ